MQIYHLALTYHGSRVCTVDEAFHHLSDGLEVVKGIVGDLWLATLHAGMQQEQDMGIVHPEAC